MASFRPRCTAIIPHRNRPDRLRKTILSLIGRWGAGLDEIHIVDDASAAHLRPVIDPAWHDLARPIVVHQLASARGPAGCRNLAANATHADYLLFLDDDAAPLTGDLSVVLQQLDRRPNVGALGLRIKLGANFESGGAFNTFVGCGALVRRSAFQAVGGYPDTLRFYAEEYGLCYRLLAAGFDVRQVKSPVVLHEKEPAMRDPSAIITGLIQNNRALFEPHAARYPALRDRLAELLDWYQVLARRWQVADAAARAVNCPLPRLQAPIWNADHASQVLGCDLLADFARRVAEAGARQVALWPVGKDCSSFLRALAQAGVQVVGILDPHDRYDLKEYVGRPVCRAAPEGTRDLVVASFSPGQCWNGLRMRFNRLGLRVFAGFGYLRPNDPAEAQTRGWILSQNRIHGYHASLRPIP